MKRTQLYLDQHVWDGLHARARSEKTTVSELVRQAVQAQYFGQWERRSKAMKAVIGIRAVSADDLDAVEEVRLLRDDGRLARLYPDEPKA